MKSSSCCCFRYLCCSLFAYSLLVCLFTRSMCLSQSAYPSIRIHTRTLLDLALILRGLGGPKKRATEAKSKLATTEQDPEPIRWAKSLARDRQNNLLSFCLLSAHVSSTRILPVPCDFLLPFSLVFTGSSRYYYCYNYYYYYHNHLALCKNKLGLARRLQARALNLAGCCCCLIEI